MTKKRVLAIGIEPSLVDFSAFPGLTAELVTSYHARLRSSSFARWAMRLIAV